MKPVLGNAWRYSALVIFLFLIIAVAAHSVIFHFEREIGALEVEGLSTWLTTAIWALTMGCMFIVGALGILAIRSSAEVESRRRIGRFVEVMDYLTDGAIALEKNGIITGINPAARKLAPRPVRKGRKTAIRDIFECVTKDDETSLASLDSPYEVERDCMYDGGLRKLRFRSQPSAGISLIIVSDVTDMRSREARERQSAQLQMVGRIAGGVAHDFNNILCAISGNAALLKRKNLPPETVEQSIISIAEQTHRGSQLSRQLLDLSRSGVTEEPSRRISEDVAEAVELLKIGLSPTWDVKADIEKEFGAVPLGSRQIVQVVLNIGMLAADSLRHPGVISVTLCRPGKTPFSHTDDRFQAVIIVSADRVQSGQTVRHQDAVPGTPVLPILDDSGVIISVVRSLVEEAGGIFQHLSGPDGLCVYRTCLPHLDAGSLRVRGSNALPDDIADYLAQCSVLLACGNNEMNAFRAELERFGVNIENRTDIVSLLSEMDSSSKTDIMILHSAILGEQAQGLVKAMVKLYPETGLVILCERSARHRFENCSEAVIADLSASNEDIIRAMLEAKAIAASRKKFN